MFKTTLLKHSISLLLIIFCVSVHAQTIPLAIFVPDSLKENAHSVIRYSNTEFIWNSITSGDEINSLMITVLENKGRNDGNFVCYCDKFKELKKFSAEIYDATGKVIRKIKKSDLQYTEYSQNLASDGKYYFFECNIPSYPFTVKYEWEIKHKNGIIRFPVFNPLNKFNQSIEKAQFTLAIPNGVDFKYKAVNMNETPSKDNGAKIPRYTWAVENFKAVESERFGPSSSSIEPVLFSTPIDFTYDGVAGNMANWQNYGIWQHGLLKDRDKLPEPLKSKVHQLTEGITNDKEKIKKIYEYLAETTRYVSIQLGIGGLQPMPASEVYTTGFGDCKALSNYMMAMLREINIPANYTEIYSGNIKRIFPDFASPIQTNHVILHVPLPNDTLWLECTNPQQIPFGYVHSDIAGHDAVLIKETGGEIYTLPTYPDSLNIEKQEVIITLSPEGKATAKIIQESHLFQYENILGFTKLTAKEQVDAIRKGIKVPKAQVSNVSFTENKEASPSITIQYDVISEQFGNKTGNRLFIPANAFRKGFDKLPNKKRNHDIYINYGYNDIDDITYILPENHIVESLPKPIIISNKYGTFTSIFTEKDNKINVSQKLQMNTGKYPAAEYENFVEFCKNVANSYDSKIVIKKEQ